MQGLTERTIVNSSLSVQDCCEGISFSKIDHTSRRIHNEHKTQARVVADRQVWLGRHGRHGSDCCRLHQCHGVIMLAPGRFLHLNFVPGGVSFAISDSSTTQIVADGSPHAISTTSAHEALGCQRQHSLYPVRILSSCGFHLLGRISCSRRWRSLLRFTP